MITVRTAAKLLAQADSLDQAHMVADAIGFRDGYIALTNDTLRELNIHEIAQHARLYSSNGSLRLCTALLNNPQTESRELTRQLGIALAKAAPTRQWCLVTLDAARRFTCIATATRNHNSVQVAALRSERNNVVDSDADTLRALASVSETDDSLRHARFTDILKRDSLSTRFYKELDKTVELLATTATGLASHTERRELALLCASRSLFLAFLQAKGWLDHNQNFLIQQCTLHLHSGRGLHNAFLKPLFFGTLNTPPARRADSARSFGNIPFLNGGLFAPTKTERRRRTLRFSDDAITVLIAELLDKYRFTAREDSDSWSEAAIDPEMLGRSFECLMAENERHRSGAFYTPPTLVEPVVTDALMCALPGLPTYTAGTNHRNQTSTPDHDTRKRIANLRILDPACGSGAFLVHILERLASLAAAAGDARPVHIIRQEILTRSIFGVDANPMAVWLCELRLWLSAVIECNETDPARVTPLPNLDHNIRVGDTLAGGNFHLKGFAKTNDKIRLSYTKSSGTKKTHLARLLDRSERLAAIDLANLQLAAAQEQRKDLLTALRSSDLFGKRNTPTRADERALDALRLRIRELQQHRTRLLNGHALPFSFATHFPAAMQNGGFSLVIGNPPWVRPHAVPARDRVRLRSEFRTLREPAWREGAVRAGAGAGFAAQADLAAAFVERSLQLLSPAGTIALLVPGKLWRTLSGGGVRKLVREETEIHNVHDWSDAPPLFHAAVYPSLIVARKRLSEINARPTDSREIQVTVARANHTSSFTTKQHDIAVTEDQTAPWLLLPKPARKAFHTLRAAGTPLGSSHLGRPTLGVKCGCNAAFLVNATEHEDDLATIKANGRTARIERISLRPVMRGEDVGQQHKAQRSTHIIWTHCKNGTPLRILPPATRRWLSQWKYELESRRDAKQKGPWWQLFRTDAARFDSARLVWADIGRNMRTEVLLQGDPTVPLNTCYAMHMASTEDAFALNALITSPAAEAWIACIAEHARGGFRRYMAWTIAAFPIPRLWIDVRPALAELGRIIAEGRKPDAESHSRIVADAYRVHADDIHPLIEWSES